MPENANALPNDIAQRLKDIREASGVTQGDVAKAMKAEQSKISRIEKEQIQLTREDVYAYLKAVGSADAKQYLAYLREEWTALGSQPAFDNPDRAALTVAENTLKTIQRALPELRGPVRAQVELYENSLTAAARYLLSTEHPIAAVGLTAAGKTTMLCAIAGLQVPGEKDPRRATVLDAGPGVTTICEVEIIPGPGTRVDIEEMAPEHLFALTRDFCESLVLGAARRSTGDQSSKEGPRVSQEIERALRIMADLPRKSGDKAIDLVNELLGKHDGDRTKVVEELCSEIQVRMRLPERQRRELVYDQNDGAELKWLQQSFGNVNNGRDPQVPLPRRMRVTVRTDLIATGLVGAGGYRTPLVDTKGIDGTAVRRDLLDRLNCARTVTVLCTNFNPAPDPSIQQLLEAAVEPGADPNALIARTVIAVLPRADEALAAKDEASGEYVSTDREGYELKRTHVVGVLRRIGMSELKIAFFNSFKPGVDPPAELVELLLERIRRMRAARAAAIDDLAKLVEQTLEGYQKDKHRRACTKVIERLQEFLDGASELAAATPSSSQQVLLDSVRNEHPSRVWAACARRGEYDQFHVYLHLGMGAASSARSRAERVVEDLVRRIWEMKGNPELEPMRGFLAEVERLLPSWKESFLRRVVAAGLETYRLPFIADGQSWADWKGLWGKNLPYRRAVADGMRGWFGDAGRNYIHSLLEERTQKAWNEEVLEPLRKLCRDQDGQIKKA